MYSLPLVKRDRVGIHSLRANACADDQPSDHARRDYDSAALQGLQHLTRIRSNYWVFQEIHAIFGSNSIAAVSAILGFLVS